MLHPCLSSLGLEWICPILSLPALEDDSSASANATKKVVRTTSEMPSGVWDLVQGWIREERTATGDDGRE